MQKMANNGTSSGKRFHMLTLSLAVMDPSSDSDGECFTVQLDGSDSSPRAQKVMSTPLRLEVGIDDLHSNQTILRQTFTMRRHRNVEIDCRLVNLAEVIE